MCIHTLDIIHYILYVNCITQNEASTKINLYPAAERLFFQLYVINYYPSNLKLNIYLLFYRYYQLNS